MWHESVRIPRAPYKGWHNGPVKNREVVWTAGGTLPSTGPGPGGRRTRGDTRCGGSAQAPARTRSSTGSGSPARWHRPPCPSPGRRPRRGTTLPRAGPTWRRPLPGPVLPPAGVTRPGTSAGKSPLGVRGAEGTKTLPRGTHGGTPAAAGTDPGASGAAYPRPPGSPRPHSPAMAAAALPGPPAGCGPSCRGWRRGRAGAAPPGPGGGAGGGGQGSGGAGAAPAPLRAGPGGGAARSWQRAAVSSETVNRIISNAAIFSSTSNLTVQTPCLHLHNIRMQFVLRCTRLFKCSYGVWGEFDSYSSARSRDSSQSKKSCSEASNYLGQTNFMKAEVQGNLCILETPVSTKFNQHLITQCGMEHKMPS